ncbi:MAG: 3-oxoacyl-[acyl-carrier-protein] reductase [Lachnospiraceae bacterium]|nr:3-oxoacyl-[acyl-carrier-protein] reductase [Lachnospiraceae bacterium]
MFDLTDRVVLITGATGGIGGAIAHKMKEAGATVVVSGRSMEKLNAQFDDGYIKIAADLADDGAGVELVMNTIEQCGKIDVLVNNAGITQDTLLMRMSDEQFDNVINTNLRSCFKMCRAAIMPMMKNRFGRIINMASIIGQIGGPGQANYAASKGGMIAMTKSIAAEVASRGITANCIAPGFIKTPMTDVLSDDLKRSYLAQIPAGRFGEPDDIAAACVFLASAEASYINGQVLAVNGGMGRF